MPLHISRSVCLSVRPSVQCAVGSLYRSVSWPAVCQDQLCPPCQLTNDTPVSSVVIRRILDIRSADRFHAQGRAAPSVCQPGRGVGRACVRANPACASRCLDPPPRFGVEFGAEKRCRQRCGGMQRLGELVCPSLLRGFLRRPSLRPSVQPAAMDAGCYQYAGGGINGTCIATTGYT